MDLSKRIKAHDFAIIVDDLHRLREIHVEVNLGRQLWLLVVAHFFILEHPAVKPSALGWR